jgi:hypothetical protein
MGFSLGDLARSNIVFAGGTVLLGVAALLTAVDQWRFAESLLLLAGLWVWLWLWYQPYKSRKFDIAVIAGSALAVLFLCYFIEHYRQDKILGRVDGIG